MGLRTPTREKGKEQACRQTRPGAGEPLATCHCIGRSCEDPQDGRVECAKFRPSVLVVEGKLEPDPNRNSDEAGDFTTPLSSN